MGPGPDGPMGAMGAMEPHHMNGSLGGCYDRVMKPVINAVVRVTMFSAWMNCFESHLSLMVSQALGTWTGCQR